MIKIQDIENEIKRRIDSVDYDLVIVKENVEGWGYIVVIVSSTFFGETINKRFDKIYDLINAKDRSFYRENDLNLILLTLKEYQNHLFRGDEESFEFLRAASKKNH